MDQALHPMGMGNRRKSIRKCLQISGLASLRCGSFAGFAGFEQAFAKVAFVVWRRIERGYVGQGVKACQTKELVKQLRRAENDCAELRTARVGDQAALSSVASADSS